MIDGAVAHPVPARRGRMLAVMLGVAAVVVTADAVSKAVALRDLPGRPAAGPAAARRGRREPR